MRMGILSKRHHQVMFAMVILACHQSEEAETADALDDIRIITGHLQYYTFGSLRHRDGPTAIVCKLPSVCWNHSP